MTSNSGSFDFEDGGRAYACRVEEGDHGRREGWWWFGVAGDDNSYAPFRADADDTQDSVRARVVAYYEDRVARRGWGAWSDRGVRLAAR